MTEYMLTVRRFRDKTPAELEEQKRASVYSTQPQIWPDGTPSDKVVDRVLDILLTDAEFQALKKSALEAFQ